MPEVECPRCGAALLPPTLLEHQYRCPRHGTVAGLAPAVPYTHESVSWVAAHSSVPVWYPSRLADGWLATGLRWAETPRRCAPAVAVGLSGHGLEAGPTDVVIVAEEPGCGLGARFAGLPEPDPGEAVLASPPSGQLRAGRRSTSLWSLATPDDRVGFVGEAEGFWLWIVGWPRTAWGLVADQPALQDARTDDDYGRLASGALNPRLAA